MAFEKIVLLSGQGRSDYIKSRLRDGAGVAAILAEINGPLLFSGEDGKSWPVQVIYAEQAKLRKATEKTSRPKVDPLVRFAPPKEGVREFHEGQIQELAIPEIEIPTIEVPPEYEGILDAADIAEIQKQAQEDIRKEQRKVAKAELLKKAKEQLAREAKLAMEAAPVRGDYVDVYLDLAPYAPNITLDGRIYEHGRTHRVPRVVAAVLYEQMQRSWHHVQNINGQRNDWNRKRNIEVSAKKGVIGAEGLLA